MNKEHTMLQAHLLRKQGFKIKDIADRIGKSERTVYYYLSEKPCPRKPRTNTSKLDQFKPIIDTILEDTPDYNKILLFEKIQKQGYSGGITILRDYARDVSRKITRELVIRFETEPGYQAQVDWLYFGKRIINGKRRQVYGFVMVFGYSRKPFVMFTTSMKQSVFLACHIAAFAYFGGIPQEILYDNMKTAFVYDMLEEMHNPV
jgi:transposase